MRFVFKDLGTKKFTKVVEVQSIIGFQDILEFCAMEIEPHLPQTGTGFELVPTDGMPDLLASQFVVVHHDSGYVARGMGQVVIYP